MSPKGRKDVAYVVPQTHWDRAWYLSFEHFRIKLVRLTENLLDTFKRKPDFTKFTFDGQTVVLEDVIQIRPELEEELKRLVQEGRLAVGPWYVLPDEFLVTGEGLVRNLLVGHQVAERFGKVMKAGYIPDPFGHVSQLPQILSGFGIDSVLFMRGVGEEGETLKSEFKWLAPDGKTWVIASHLVGGYGNICGWGQIHGIPLEDDRVDYERALEQANSAIAHLRAKRPTTNVLLLNNGVDHFPAQPSVPDMIKYVNERVEDCELIQGDYQEYVEALKAAKPKLQTFQGELHNGKYFPLLSGVFSARMYLKQANDRCLRLLESYAEPLSAIAWLEGKKYPAEFLSYAWKETLKNHPHDDICGCSIDAVHRDMVNRFDHSSQVSQNFADEGFHFIGTKVDTASGPSGAPIIVFNPTAWKRNDSVKVRAMIESSSIPDGKTMVVDSTGKRIPATIKLYPVREHHVWKEGVLEKIPVHDADVEFLADSLPAFGIKTFYIATEKGIEPKPRVSASAKTLENEFLQVTVNKDGTLKIKDKETGFVYPNALVFEDTEDVGDEYDYSPLPKDATSTFTSDKHAQVKSVQVVESTAFKASIEIVLAFSIPKEIAADRKKRSSAKVAVPVKTVVTLQAGSKRMDFVTTIDNKAKDHRVRVLFPTGVQTDKVYAASKFDVVERPAVFPKGEGWSQVPVPTKHVDAFVSADDGKIGLTVINQGLPEYEARPSKKGLVLCQTLFRSCGWLSRDDLQTRPYNAGPSIPTPEAQCLGENTYRYAITPHAGGWERAKSYITAIQHNVEVWARQEDRHPGPIGKSASFIQIAPDSLVLSAVKKAERGDALIVRFYNIGTKTVKGKITFLQPVRSARLVNLNEEPLKKLAVSKQNSVEVEALPKGIVTIEVA